MASDNPAENLCLSCDDKNNVNVGTTVSVVSRYHKVGRMFFYSDAVDHLDHFDHSFPEPNSKIKPTGYMKLENKRSVIPGVGRPRLHKAVPIFITTKKGQR